MVQIRLAQEEKHKQGDEEAPVVEAVLLPGPGPAPPSRPQVCRTALSLLLALLSVVFAAGAVKQLCDLKAENLRLAGELGRARQELAALKLTVRDNVPEPTFLQHRWGGKEAEMVEEEGKAAVGRPERGWTVNLSVLWTSPTISPCDMAQLSRALAMEIYSGQQTGVPAPWHSLESEEEELENELEEEVEDLLVVEEEEADEALEMGWLDAIQMEESEEESGESDEVDEVDSDALETILREISSASGSYEHYDYDKLHEYYGEEYPDSYYAEDYGLSPLPEMAYQEYYN